MIFPNIGDPVRTLKSIKSYENKLKTTPQKRYIEKGRRLLKDSKRRNNKKLLPIAIWNFKMAVSRKKTREALLYLGKSLYILGKKEKKIELFERSIASYKEAISLKGSNGREEVLYIEKARVWMAMHSISGEIFEIKKAIRSYEKAISISNNSTSIKEIGEAYIKLGLLTNNNSSYIKASEYLIRAIKNSKHPKKSLFYLLATSFRELYINTSDDIFFKKADLAYEKYLKLSPKDICVIEERGELLGEAGRLKRDIDLLKASVNILKNKKNPTSISQIAKSFSDIGLLLERPDIIKKAKNLLKPYLCKNNINILYANATAYISLSRYYETDPHFEELAIENLQKAISIDKKIPEVWHALFSCYKRMGIYYEDDKLLKKAKNCLERANALKPACFEILFDLARLSLKRYNLEERFSFLKSSLFYIKKAFLIKFFKTPKDLFIYANILEKIGEYFLSESENLESSLKFYKKALNLFLKIKLLDKSFKKIDYHIALSYSKIGDITSEYHFFEKAKKFFSLEIKRDLEDEKSYLELALSIISLAEEAIVPDKRLYEKALFYLLKARQLGSTHAYYFLGCLYSILKRPKEALIALKMAKKHKILPSLKDLLDDEWLENFKMDKNFLIFVKELESDIKR